MIRLLLNKRTFARNKLRRNMNFDPKLKNFANTNTAQKQQQQFRKQFQQDRKTIFSQVLSEKKPNLGKRFYVDQQNLSKQLKKSYKQGIHRSRQEPARGDDFNFLEQDKSHLYDQTKVLEFEEKFQKQLFRKKETNRLIEKQRLKPTNYIVGKQNQQYLEYQQAKNQLKNLKIQNMLNFKRGNEQLQLLIQSGFVDDPQNLELLIQHHQKKNQLSMNLLGSSLDSTNNSIQRQDKEAYNKQIIKQVVQEPKNEIVKTEAEKLGLKVFGPDQMGNLEKIDEYLHNYNHISQQEQQNCQKQLQLLKKIKQYEQNIFLSRYDAINFRYGNRVQFSHFKEVQLLSYLKHQQIQPKQLFQIFSQNETKISKQNQPIITPSIMSRIYTKSSFYQFPETDENNRINMLNDPLFIQLQKKLFKNIDKIDDSFFAECVWAYGKNHSQQMGLLKPDMSMKVQSTIFQQLKHRITYMQEDNLGLILKSILKMPLMTFQEVNWSSIVQIIQQRLPSIQDNYVRQNIIIFLTLLPNSYYQKTLDIVSKNLSSLCSYSWDFIETLTCFLKASAFLLRFQQFIDKEVTESIGKQLYSKASQISQLIPKISINSIPHLITVIVTSGIRHPSVTKLINGCKKQAIDILHTQKERLSEKGLLSISLSIAMIDFQNSLYPISESQQKFKIVKPITMSKILFTGLFPFRVFDYNSIQYYFYHELGRFTQSQLNFLRPTTIVQTMLGFSIVGYKNQMFYDSIFTNLLKRFDSQENLTAGEKIICYFNIIKCYYLQKRITTIYNQVLSRIENILCYQQVNLSVENYISLFLCLYSLEGKNLSNKLGRIYQQIMRSYIEPLLYLLDKQLLLSILFTQSIYNKDSKRIIAIVDQLKQNNFSYMIEQQFLIFVCKSYLGANIDPSLLKSDKIQATFFKHIKPILLKNQQHIGTRLSYTANYNKIKQQLQAKNEQITVKQKPMILQIATNKKIYFFATYDHLLTRYDQNQKAFVSLFGIWKSYQLYYISKGYSFEIICTFLQ